MLRVIKLLNKSIDDYIAEDASRPDNRSNIVDEKILSKVSSSNLTDYENTRIDRIEKWHSGNDNGSEVFNDIEKSQYIDSIGQMFMNNVIDGHGDGTFKPNDNIERAAACKIVMNCLYSDFDI